MQRRRWFRWVVASAGVLLVAVCLMVAYVLLSPRRTPAGQPPLANLQGGDPRPFEEAFDARLDSTRILVLLSPT